MDISTSSSSGSFDINPLRLACTRGDSVELERHLLDFTEDINLTDDDGNTLLHLASQAGSLNCIQLLIERDAVTDIINNNKDTPLHLAALSGSRDSIKYLIHRGANLLAKNKDNFLALGLILETVPDAEIFLKDLFDECVEMTRLITGREALKVNMKILCPNNQGNNMAVLNQLYSRHSEMHNLLLHPLLKVLIYLEWEKCKHIIWYRFTTYLIYLTVLTIYISTHPLCVLSTITRIMVGLLSVHVMLFSLLYAFPVQYSPLFKLIKTLFTLFPPLLSIIAISFPYNAEWCGISFLFSWLSLPFYTNAIHVIGNQAGMFIYVTKELCKHSLVLIFVLVGFSLVFFVLYYDKDSRQFDSFWHAFLYTTLVLLQGDNFGDFPIFGLNSTTNSTSDVVDHLNYVTEALFSMRFASVLVSLLFVLIVIIALVNMLIALAIKGAEELRNYGDVYHLRCQVQLMYEWEEVLLYFEGQDFGYEAIGDRDYEIDRNMPSSLRSELRRLALTKRDTGSEYSS